MKKIYLLIVILTIACSKANGLMEAKEKKYMEKFKKFYFIFFLIITSSFGQQKTIIPTKGIVVFNCTEEIYDSKLYKDSKKDFLKSMFQSVAPTVKREREELGIDVDSIQLKSVVELASQIDTDGLFSKKDIKYYIEYRDSLVTKKEIKNGVDQYPVVINSETRKFKNDYAEGIYDAAGIKILNLEVNKNDTKIIFGYKCFKIIYSFVEFDVDDKEYNEFISNFATKREMWVTDKIKSNFHPIINDLETLEKYYPLEIMEFSDMAKGVKTIYTIEKFSLK
jgi:hypothetical protein